MEQEGANMRDELLTCDGCNKRFEHLYTREVYRFGHAVEWVCADCYEEKFGLPWTDVVEEVKYEAV